MKIAMLVEYYFPFDRGGSEWSTHDLGKLLVENGHEVNIITPNFGAESTKVHDRIKIFRFPFLIKLKNKTSFVNPFWTNNILWFFYSAFQIIKICNAERIDVIHIQSRNFIVPAKIASIFLRKPLVVTFRDYQILCSLGFCLLDKTKKCTLFEYITSDIPYSLKHYVEHTNLAIIILYYIIALRSKFMDYIVNFTAKSIHTKICISKRQKEILKNNGYTKLRVIYNSIIFPASQPKHKKMDWIIFVGKLSSGKGIELLIKAFPNIISRTKQKLRLKVIGEGILLDKLMLLSSNLNITKYIDILGHRSHSDVIKNISNSKILVAPSTWEEPFGRIVVEAFSQNTPVIVSKKGAFPELIDEDKSGLLIDLDPKSIANSVALMFNSYSKFQKHVESNWENNKKKYEQNTVKSYIKIYSKLIS